MKLTQVAGRQDMNVDPNTIKLTTETYQFNEYLPPGKHYFYFIKNMTSFEEE